MLKKEEVKHIAKLARLGLTEKEVEKFQAELSSILNYFEKLKKINVAGITPTSHPFLVENVKRGDEKKPKIKDEKLLESAPEIKGNYFKVKSVIKPST